MASQQHRRRRPGTGRPLRSRRGAVARSWWSQRFLAAAASGGHPGRLARGLTYARAGQVLRTDHRPGAVTARVQGSRDRPYLVEVGVRRWTASEVEAVVAVVVENPLLLAPLFAGEVPPALVDLLTEVGVELLPTAEEVTYDCSCPDDGEPCKHAAAVVHVVAEHLDEAPATALQLRGVDLADLLARVERAASGPSSPADDLARHVTRGAGGFHRTLGLDVTDLPTLAPTRRATGRTAADDLDEEVLGRDAAGVREALRPWYEALDRPAR